MCDIERSEELRQWPSERKRTREGGQRKPTRQGICVYVNERERVRETGGERETEGGGKQVMERKVRIKETWRTGEPCKSPRDNGSPKTSIQVILSYCILPRLINTQCMRTSGRGS